MPNEIEDVTRICIKNLPPNFTESKLRSHLISNSQIQLVITDCKILRTKEGVSRKIGFVGFKTSEVSWSLEVYLCIDELLDCKKEFILNFNSNTDGDVCNILL